MKHAWLSPLQPGRLLAALVVILLATQLSFADETQNPPQPDELRLFWDNGLNLKSTDDALAVKLGGKIMWDFTWANGRALQNDTGVDLRDTARCRRIEPFVKVTLFKRLEFMLQAEFAGAGTKLLDAYMRIKDLPAVGDLTIGRFKQPLGLDQLTSSADITFLERALPDVFTPRRTWGIMAANTAFNKRATWAVGIFRDFDSKSYGDIDAGRACNITGRVTCLPWYEDDGRKLLHLGAAYSLGRPKDDIRYKQRPEAKFVDNFTDTGSFEAEWVQLVGAELLWIHGPFSFQSEYTGAFVDSHEAGGLSLSGFYFQTSYFLTGEHRPYNTAKGVPGRVRPSRPVFSFQPDEQDGERGFGAWEVAARYSYLDLNEGALPDSARRLQDATFGLNWYLNSNTRVTWNYIRSCVNAADTSDAADIFLMRLQLVF